MKRLLDGFYYGYYLWFSWVTFGDKMPIINISSSLSFDLVCVIFGVRQILSICFGWSFWPMGNFFLFSVMVISSYSFMAFQPILRMHHKRIVKKFSSYSKRQNIVLCTLVMFFNCLLTYFGFIHMFIMLL